MSLIVFVILSLTIATAVVSSYDCDCEHTLASNDFYGNHDCFNAYYKIEQHLKSKYYINDISKEIDTLCNGECGEAANRILYYRDRTRFRQVGCFKLQVHVLFLLLILCSQTILSILFMTLMIGTCHLKN